MLYLFGWPGWIKMGYAKRCPYDRLQLGFWHNDHPAALCGRLDECVLLHAFACDMATEEALHSALGPDCGEFYVASRLPELLGLLSMALEPLPLPPARPITPVLPKMMKPCCGGEHGGYQRDDHRRRSAATTGLKAPCPRCGKSVGVRRDKLKKHQESRACRPVRLAPAAATSADDE